MSFKPRLVLVSHKCLEVGEKRGERRCGRKREKRSRGLRETDETCWPAEISNTYMYAECIFLVSWSIWETLICWLRKWNSYQCNSESCYSCCSWVRKALSIYMWAWAAVKHTVWTTDILKSKNEGMFTKAPCDIVVRERWRERRGCTYTVSCEIQHKGI